jgi:hypothetical protein
MIGFCKAFHSPKSHPGRCFCSLFCDGTEVPQSRLEPPLDGIQEAARGLTECRNSICHGDFYSLDEATFDKLQECSGKLLQHIGEVACIMVNDVRAQTFQRIRNAVACQEQEMFRDDYTQQPPRVCIMNRRVELTPEERQHFDAMMQSYQSEISDLKDQVSSMKKRQYDRLPVCMKREIEEQIVGQSGKEGGQGVVYDVNLWGELLAAKVFRSVDAEWRRELNSLTALLHSNIVQVKYVMYDGVDGKRKQGPVGYVMERMHCTLHDHCRHASLQLTHLLALLKQVALALAYCPYP